MHIVRQKILIPLLTRTSMKLVFKRMNRSKKEGLSKRSVSKTLSHSSLAIVKKRNDKNGSNME